MIISLKSIATSVRSVKKDIYFPLTENENESDLYVKKIRKDLEGKTGLRFNF